MKPTTLYDMLLEMGTWFTTSKEDLEIAKKLKINTDNNNFFRALVADWVLGTYDEDPDMMYDYLIGFIEETKQ